MRNIKGIQYNNSFVTELVNKLYFLFFLYTFVHSRRGIHFQRKSPKLKFNFHKNVKYFIRLKVVYNFCALKISLIS